ncbi:hypothetical protein C0Q70_02821 [Pomacea canaliculata]|uniref:3-hydroxyisobutyrate dehydrogenase n=1 Tax=Pomacea canaliculata TaxID=400727 RepID=A0A2T7PQZ6_POMCA|nr:3-hydroxyisobutyrate dehydrogenase, mitochondrial-like isoform X2 [Pomacea canaliculata]XP_025084566.1 3-hydroxyisobutyrate dehydrogenase, mitochondrial-like isoform X2 [Pomacea canaliculata]XP_025084567.1 3-hydroxyisobutyrate dehydrogenase, mitochondrial-like isoform X2 [Pomacea canaliculata]PVD35852.1 hypothetical protein C0Q70_02821 [Pomacea canaliculata]
MSALVKGCTNHGVLFGFLCRRRHLAFPRYMSNATVGFVGLGNMGSHMARNLLKKGHPVVAYDAVPQNVLALKADGASVVGSPKEVASQTSILVTMLPASSHVLDVYTGSSGILRSVQKGSLLIDSSTIDPSVAQQIAQESKASCATFVDAPVSGGVNAARDSLLTFMVGAEKEEDFVRVKEILNKMGKNVVHCGPVGTGQAAKICNNMLLGISMIGTAEAMNLGIKLGLDPKLLAKILNMSSGRCWSSEVYNPVPGVVEGVPSGNNYKGGFGSALMAKDLGLAQNAATLIKAPTPLGSLSHQIYRIMVNSGYAEKDFSSAFKFLQDQAAEKKEC